MAESDKIRDEIREYILSDLLQGGLLQNLKDDAPLRTNGAIDSMGMLRLIGFIEQRFGIEIEPHEVAEGNLDRIADMVMFVRRKVTS